MKGIKILVALSLLCNAAALGQRQVDLKSYQEKYKSEQIAVLNSAETLKIQFDKSGELDIVKNRVEEIVYLTDKARMFNKESISYGFFSSVEEIEAKSYEPTEKAGKYKTYKVKTFNHRDEWTPGIFHDDSKSVNFYYQKLKEGSQTYLNYDRRITQPRYSDVIYFASPVPKESQTYTIQFPKEVEIIWKKFNMDGIAFEFNESEDGNMKTYTWTANNLKDFKSEEGSPAFSAFAPHIVLYIGSYESNGKVVGLQRNSADLFSWYDELINKHLDNNGELSEELKQVVDSLTTGDLTEKEKVKNIFYWTQDNIKYVAFEEGMGGFIPRAANEICKKKFGDCKDMSAIINAMASYAEVPTHFVWIGSRDIPYSYSDVPTLMVDNHMIAAYFDQSGQVYFLDATGSEEAFGTPTAFIQGKEGLIKTGDGRHVIKKVPIVPASQNFFSETAHLSLEEGKLKGEATLSAGGYYKGRLNYFLEGKDDDEKEKFYESYLNKGNNKCSVEVKSEEELQNKDVISKLTYEFEIEDYVIEIEDEIIINFNLQTYYSKDKLKADRESPREFKFLSSQEMDLVFDIPEGYEVSVLPNSDSFNQNNLEANFSYQVKNNQVHFKVSMSVNQLVLEKSDFQNWNDFVKFLKKQYKQSLVLKKLN